MFHGVSESVLSTAFTVDVHEDTTFDLGSLVYRIFCINKTGKTDFEGSEKKLHIQKLHMLYSPLALF